MDIFQEGLVHGFCPKFELFLMAVFHRNHIRKHRFGYCGKKRMILRGKIEVFKWAKKWSISKEVSSWILSKNRNFSYRCFSLKLCQKTSFFDIYERKQLFLDQNIEVLRRAKKWTFFKGVSPWILSKNRNFFYRCFSVKLWQKTSFFDIYERKQLFLDQKIEVLTRPKKVTFFKGVSPWIFFQKFNFFSWAFSTEIILENIVLDIVERKE